MRSHLNWWLQQVLEAFDVAADMWLAAREQYANGHDTENEMFAEATPAPQLKTFLTSYAYKQGER